MQKSSVLLALVGVIEYILKGSSPILRRQSYPFRVDDIHLLARGRCVGPFFILYREYFRAWGWEEYIWLLAKNVFYDHVLIPRPMSPSSPRRAFIPQP